MPEDRFPTGKALYDAVKAWVELVEEAADVTCPFHDLATPPACSSMSGHDRDVQPCFAILRLSPKKAAADTNAYVYYACPCYVYGHNTVWAAAKDFLGRYKEEVSNAEE